MYRQYLLNHSDGLLLFNIRARRESTVSKGLDGHDGKAAEVSGDSNRLPDAYRNNLTLDKRPI